MLIYDYKLFLFNLKENDLNILKKFCLQKINDDFSRFFLKQDLSITFLKYHNI